jgi:hypothetical protein
MECACCRRPVEPDKAFRGNTDLFYCCIFCADSEIVDSPGPLLRRTRDTNRSQEAA